MQIYAKKVRHDQQTLPARSPQIWFCQELFIIAADSFTQNRSVKAAAVVPADMWGNVVPIRKLYHFCIKDVMQKT